MAAPPAIGAWTNARKVNARRTAAALERQKKSVQLARKRMHPVEIAKALHVHVSTVERDLRGYERRTGKKLPWRKTVTGRPAMPPTEAEAAAARLCNGKRSLAEIAEILGCTKDAAHSRILEARRKTGRALPLVRSTAAKPFSAETIEAQRRIDHQLETAPECEGCGMRIYPSKISVHECPRRRLADFVSSGTTNFAGLQRWS